MKSTELREKAGKVLVGGVSCGWNSMKDIGATHIKRAEGSHIWDVDDKEYIDFSMGWASLFLGHTPDFYKDTIQQAAEIGYGFQYESEYHIKLANLLSEVIPCAEKVRLTNTGTESTMYAIRIARTYTGKEKIIKFEGHFHGVNDYLNFSNDATPNIGERFSNGSIKPLPGSAGIPKKLEEYIITLQYNDIDSFYRILEEERENIAGVILEPICLASVIMFPQNNFLQKLRKACDEEGIVLIFDEIMSGFRERIGGVQSYYNVIPDITTISKIMGCGFIISAIVGKSEFMNVLDPIGECVASGTNTGRLLSVIGSYNALNYLKNHKELYARDKSDRQ
jgi:glutamate-1-semialdehyde 2,1-aminomutase